MGPDSMILDWLHDVKFQFAEMKNAYVRNFHYVYSLNIIPSAVKQVYVSTTFFLFFKLMYLLT